MYFIILHNEVSEFATKVFTQLVFFYYYISCNNIKKKKKDFLSGLNPCIVDHRSYYHNLN